MTALCTIGASPLGFFADDAVFIAARVTAPAPARPLVPDSLASVSRSNSLLR